MSATKRWPTAARKPRATTSPSATIAATGPTATSASTGRTGRGATSVPVDPSPSWLVIGFAFAAALVTGVLFGAAPAIVGSRSDPIDALRGAGRTTGDGGGRLRSSLIAVQVALSLVLLTCAGLLSRTLLKLESQDFGVRLDSRYVVNLAPSLSTVAPEELPSLYDRLRERLKRIPGVRNAAFSLYAPMSGDNWGTTIVVQAPTQVERRSVSWNRVSPEYFATVGTPILRRVIADPNLRRAVFMLQKEVAQRVTAKPGDEQYGFLTLFTQLFATTRILMTLGPRSFYPSPKVDSAVVVLDPHAPQLSSDRDALIDLISASFRMRRKKLVNNLNAWPRDRVLDAMRDAGIDEGVRAETMSLAQFDALAARLR